jgi:hypothetical protein
MFQFVYEILSIGLNLNMKYSLTKVFSNFVDKLGQLSAKGNSAFKRMMNQCQPDRPTNEIIPHTQ